MNPERWHEIDKLFQAAVDLPAKGRAAFLDEACAGDDALRNKVESMLTSDSDEWNFINESALEMAAPFLCEDQPRLHAGQVVGHYEIVNLIGKGGMGEVYLAQDKTLSRNVALKLLPFDYAEDKDRLRRFQQEAHAASALNHPNILTIYELGVADQQQFIATEFVEGETLRQRLTRGRPTVSEVLDVAVQTASALGAAHQAGIVHRDIKPENIMLRPDGYVKVLDFGLAKLTEQRQRSPQAQTTTTRGLAALGPRLADELNTSSGLVMGTVKYMSPEQAQGLPVDPRSDIFSLGAVLYEMVAGHQPFQGETAGELIKSILKDEPSSLAVRVPPLPEKLVAIIGRALSKRSERRYQAAAGLLADLRSLKEELELEFKLQHSPPSRAVNTQGVGDNSTISTNRSSTLTAAAASATSSIARSLIAKMGEHKTASALMLALTIAVFGLVYLPKKGTPAPNPRVAPLLNIWTTRASMPTPVIEAACVVFGGRMYVLDGEFGGGISAPQVYDPVADSWSLRAPDPVVRSASAAGVIGNRIYVAEGWLNSDFNTPTTALAIYDPDTNTWTSGAPSLIARGASASAVIGTKLYVAGGVTRSKSVKFSDLEIYDAPTNRWSQGAPLPMALEGAAGAAIDGRFYVVAGEYGPTNTNNIPSGSLFIYDPVTNGWSTGAAMPTPRSGAAAGVINGKLFIVGGSAGGKGLSTTEVYNPASNSWTTGPAAPAARQMHVAGVINSNLYIAGGYKSSGIDGTLDVLNQKYSPTSPGPAPVPSPTCMPAPSGLIGWWPGDGTAKDIARTDHGTAQGKAGFVAGKVGQAFSFNGSSFVTMGNRATLNLTGKEVTIAGWINPRLNNSAILFGKTEYGLNDYLLLSNGNLHGLIKSGGSEWVVFGYSDFPANTAKFVPAIGQWTHIALTYDGSMMRIYANGTLIGEESKTGNIAGDKVPFNIGGRADDNGTGKFEGLIDEVEVFSRALSQTEIQGLFNAGSAGLCKAPARRP